MSVACFAEGLRPVRVAAHRAGGFAEHQDDQNVNLNRRKLQKMTNRIDNVAFYRGDEKAAIDRVRRTAGIELAANQ